MTQPLDDFTTAATRLRAERDELQARLRAVRADQSRAREALSLDWPDRATQRENDDVVNAIGASVESELTLIQQALDRIAALANYPP
jgi:RNA polymerase-binding transcription factor DksA